MKHLKKVIALVIAAMMIASMSVSVLANSITITQSKNDKATHTYGAYQIFKGTVKDGKLEKIEWGDNIDKDKLGDLATALNTMRPVPADGADPLFANLTATDKAAAFAAAIGKLEGSSTDSVGGQKIAEAIYKAIKKTPAAQTGTYTTPNAVYKIDNLDPGYYLVEDTEDPENVGNSAPNSGAKTRYMLQLVGDVNVTEKADAPSVDKEVQDETEDQDIRATGDDGWGETADHAINESFKFKLTATIPAEVDLAKYDNGYKVVFTDKMSQGVTFESVETVKINGVAIDPAQSASATTEATPGYKLSDNAVDGLKGEAEWTVTIDDITVFNPVKTAILAQAPADEGDPDPRVVTIEVVYKAHLNNEAKLYDADVSNDVANNNKVSLTYSNNPNAGGEGETGDTPEDAVWVFTYKVDNTKFSETTAPSHALKGAGFTLYKGDMTQVEDATTLANAVVALKWDADKKAYRPVEDGETPETNNEIVSREETDILGTFNIIGLDTGTYTLKETKVPAGFNKAADVKIEIEAQHNEHTSTAGADLKLTKSENMDNSVENKTGTVLPSTGGIGTTLFYVIGAILILGAGVLLITRRRMSAN